jgi:hypothetical protein
MLIGGGFEYLCSLGQQLVSIVFMGIQRDPFKLPDDELMFSLIWGFLVLSGSLYFPFFSVLFAGFRSVSAGFFAVLFAVALACNILISARP